MNVAMVVRELESHTGVGRHVTGLIGAMKGIEITLFSVRTEGGEPHVAVPRKKSRFPFYEIPQARLFQRAIARHPTRFDVTHAHDSYLLRPDVVTMHSSWEHFLRTSMSRKFRLLYPRNWTARPFERLFLRRAKHVIAVSEGLREALCRLHKLAPDRVHAIPNAVDHNEFSPRKGHQYVRQRHGIDEKAPCFLFVGNEYERKGLEPLIRGLAVSEHKDAVILVVGRRAPGAYAELATRLGVGNRVHFAGFVDRRELPFYYSTATALALLSAYEPFGLVSLEAMACGSTVLTTYNDGAKEIFRSGRGGIIIPVRPSPEQVAAGMDRVLTDAARLQREAHQESLRYNWADVADRTARVYEMAARR